MNECFEHFFKQVLVVATVAIATLSIQSLFVGYTIYLPCVVCKDEINVFRYSNPHMILRPKHFQFF